MARTPSRHVRSSTYDQRPRTKDLLKVSPQRADNSSMNIHGHAARQAATRGIDVAEVVSIVNERVPARTLASYAVLVGYAEGFRGFSNGDVVWAIVRGDTLTTVMFRRSDQPSTPAAFDTEGVVA